MSGKKKRRVFLVILLFIIVAPLIMVGLSFIGRIAPDSVIPDSFELYASVPDPARLARRVLQHEPLPDIMALAELAPLMSVLNQVRNSGLTESRWIRLAAGGKLEAAVLPAGQLLAVWDAGVVSPFLRFLPMLAGRVRVPGLYYVQAGGYSRFEFRLDDGTVFFIGPHKNLLVISNNSALFESVLGGTSRDGDRIGSGEKTFSSRNHDIALLLSPQALINALGSDETDPNLRSALNLLRFPGPVELSLSVLPNQLNLDLVTPLGTNNAALRRIIERNSPATPLLAMVPSNAQYMTLLSAGNLRELLNGASAISAGTPAGPELENILRRADSAARTTLRMNLDELLFSWTGTQFAVYGLEGRPNPVIAVEIADETKRREVFNRAFSTIFLTEDIRLNLDGNRIPRIQIPGFLNSLLSFLGVNMPAPFYVVQNNYLFISESAETLLAAVNAVRRNEVLPRQELWRTLSEDNSGPSSFTLFYSLDRSMPFFLRGNNEVSAVLRLYRHGLARLTLQDSVLNLSLSLIPGAGRGLVPVAGYPIELSDAAGGRAGNRLFSIPSGRGGRDSKLLLTRGSDVLAINPVDRSIIELSGFGSHRATVHAIPQTGGEGAAWIVDSQGHVSLVNSDLSSLRGFPLSTGLRLSAPPESHGGRLFLSGEDGAVYTVDNRASVSRWGTFSSALRSPPSFLDFNNRTFVGAYPKDIIFGEIFILDADGRPLPAWPVQVPGIAFGSPLLFSARHSGSPARLFAAFITQAGDLAVYTEAAEIIPGFPVALAGIFFLQPVFDGENLWIIEAGGTLYRISLAGEVFSQSIPRLTVREEGYITVAGGEIFFTGEGNALHGYSQNFNSLDGFPLPIWGRPVIEDLDRDGKTEIAGVGMDNRLYMWQFR